MKEKQLQEKRESTMKVHSQIGNATLFQTSEGMTIVWQKFGEEPNKAMAITEPSASNAFYRLAEHLDDEIISATMDSIGEIMKDPVKVKRATFLAQQIGEATRWNWFTIKKLSSKTKNGPEELRTKLELLELFGMVITQTIGRNPKQYKIITNDKARKLMLQEKKKQLHGRIQEIEKQIQALDENDN